MANSTRRGRWLQGQISEWAKAGLLPAEVEAGLRAHSAESGRSGAGIPGVQGLAVFALLKRRGSMAWGEASGVLLTLACGATLALIEQTYQIPGDLRGFLTSWCWLTLPVVYGLASRGAALLVLAQIMALSGWFFADGEPDPWHWFRLFALAPFGFMLWREHASGLRERVLAMSMQVALVASALMGLVLINGFVLVVGAGVLAAGLHAFGSAEAEGAEERDAARGSARVLGLLGMATLVLFFGFGPTWEVVELRGSDELYLLTVVPAIATTLGFGWLTLRRVMLGSTGSRRDDFIALAQPFLLGLGAWCALSFEESAGQMGAAFLISGYGLVLGCSQVLNGLRSGERFRANLGMALLASVMGLRFLDWEWSFTARGVAFILAGAAFLLLNLRLKRLQNGPSSAGDELAREVMR
jgi:hypothetical protein